MTRGRRIWTGGAEEAVDVEVCGESVVVGSRKREALSQGSVQVRRVHWR